MNKKFVKVSLIICVPLILMLGLFSVIAKNQGVSEEWAEDIQITYKDYKETKDSYNVSVIVKNKSKNIASMSDMELSFTYEGQSTDMGDFYIKGYEKDMWDENKKMGIDPGEDEEFIFKIPKGIKIDNKYYNTKRMNIDYNANFFKFRMSQNSLFLGVSQTGGTQTIGEQY